MKVTQYPLFLALGLVACSPDESNPETNTHGDTAPAGDDYAGDADQGDAGDASTGDAATGDAATGDAATGDAATGDADIGYVPLATWNEGLPTSGLSQYDLNGLWVTDCTAHADRSIIERLLFECSASTCARVDSRTSAYNGAVDCTGTPVVFTWGLVPIFGDTDVQGFQQVDFLFATQFVTFNSVDVLPAAGTCDKNDWQVGVEYDWVTAGGVRCLAEQTGFINRGDVMMTLHLKRSADTFVTTTPTTYTLTQ